ncbi:iron complex outermembrane recepter protein [Hydrobacter penzbergensis]|uniref:Iron complex outermembrane recepter protein n=1 Tax=Hydrobacter penzbergensis TaxID=1235997 RepID=A0A8X8IHU8_9BACT|nr:SusC/RagA family TonB-linked outer membrane protein [Hydrobacter penzbergensis]SDX45187.1 iron complex outermembrane recepter protein [Hydrobacter penzbergensis]
MNVKRLLLLMILPALLLQLSAQAQQRTVTGKVTDSRNGTALQSVSVTVKGSSVGTQTAADGSFSLKVPSGATTLMISSIGYANREVKISDGAVNVALEPIDKALGDVIVIAYGTRKKSDLTSSVTAISAKDFQKGSIASSEQLLQGKVAGLEITSGGGAAGGGSRIRIRGGASLNASNDPLIVIDGIAVDGNGVAGSANLLNTINPNDIESISVLKDASATALYGSRASNGVLIITTKKGFKGKVRYNFNTQVSSGSVAKTVGVLSGDEIRSIINADAAASGDNTYKKLLGTANTDWQKQIYKTAIGNDNNISASGGIGNIPFRLSLGYLNQDGILKTDHFDRMSSALNLSPKFFDNHLSVEVAVKASRTTNRFADQGAIGSAVAFDPTQPVYANNKYGGYYEWLQPDGKPIDLSTRNPLALLNLRDNRSTVNRLIGNVQLDYKLHFFPDLHVLTNLGIDNASGSGNDNTDSVSATNYKTAGRYVHYEQKKKYTLAGVSLLYNKDIRSIDSKLDVLVSHEYQDFVTEVSNFASYGQNGVLIPGSTPTFATDRPEFRMESYLGRLNYSLADKYFLSASIRRDASSKFSTANRVGYFPAVSVAWKINEDFFKGSSVVNELKFRASVGVTGQQDIGNYYGYLPKYSQSSNTAQYQFGNTFYSFLRPSAYDPNIKWETTTTTNLGLDFAFLNNRISGSVDVYKKKTKDLLSVIPVAPGSNFDIALLTNVGNIENKGVEFAVNTIPVKQKDLEWDLGFNFTYNKTEITNLLKQQDPNFKGIDVGGISGGTGNNIGKFAVGYAPYVYNVYKQIYDRTTGKPIESLYDDLNRDGRIDESDRYYYKKPSADILLGINTQVIYKRISVGFAAHGSLGGYLYNNFNSNNGVLRAIKNPINFIGNASRDYLYTGFVNNQYLSDYYIENASFLRLDNINFGYNAGKVFNNRAQMRISASVQNVFVITKYKGLDPENSNSSGVDNNIYPRPRVFSLGLNFDF